MKSGRKKSASNAKSPMFTIFKYMEAVLKSKPDLVSLNGDKAVTDISGFLFPLP